MKLIWRILSRLSVALLVLLALWAVAFYAIVTAEINDETDDALENYAHDLIVRTLTGESLPTVDNGTNNTYYLRDITSAEAASRPAVSYSDESMWIASKMETEPARVLRTIFADAAGDFRELTVAIPSYEKRDLQGRILTWLLILYALMLGGVLAVCALIVRRSFRPLYSLLDWLSGVRPDKPVPPFEVSTGVEEFRLLNDAVVGSVRRAGEMFNEQRLFTGNAAHELQTPIAVCRARLELIAADPSLSEEQLSQLGAVLETLDRLAGLNRTLLLLTRIDNHGFPDSVSVDAGSVLRGLADDFGEVFGFRGVTVSIIESEPFFVEMNKTLAGVLWGNLLKNAFLHSPSESRVDVNISASGVTISNDAGGAGGGPLDPKIIFRRFYRGGGSEETAGGVGLGLALVESICRLYGLKVAYDFVENKHLFKIGK